MVVGAVVAIAFLIIFIIIYRERLYELGLRLIGMGDVSQSPITRQP
jgi:hypothetical protein